MGEPGDCFQAEAPGEVIPFIPRANEAGEMRNGFVRGGITRIPCAGGTCSYAAPKLDLKRGKGIDSNACVVAKENGNLAEFPFEQMYLGS